MKLLKIRPNFHECVLVLVIWCFCEVATFSVQRTDSFDNDDDNPFNYEMVLTNSEPNNLFESFKKSDHHHLGKEINDAEEQNNSRMIFLLYFNHNNRTTPDSEDSTPLDSWSVVWYIASFGGLIAFFLVVSCSEWCCRRAVRNSNNCNVPATQTNNNNNAQITDSPPPSYEEFAPPSYESICLGRSGIGEKSEYDVYVVPVHMVGTIVNEDAPPSYLNLQQSPSIFPDNLRT